MTDWKDLMMKTKAKTKTKRTLKRPQTISEPLTTP